MMHGNPACGKQPPTPKQPFRNVDETEGYDWAESFREDKERLGEGSQARIEKPS